MAVSAEFPLKIPFSPQLSSTLLPPLLFLLVRNPSLFYLVQDVVPMECYYIKNSLQGLASHLSGLWSQMKSAHTAFIFNMP